MTPPSATRNRVPTVGFVSLGCPKATVDSEQILTRLSAEGYALSSSYAGADLVVVNTCGFIDEAIHESLDAIGEALAENGKVIVTGCLGAHQHQERVRSAHAAVLAVTGPHDLEGVMGAIHHHLPPPAAATSGAVLPPQGIKLTPQHYAYLKISEGCNHHCTFCIIPSLRGPLVSRSVDQILREAEVMVGAGVRELLVVSQDTSAYGVDLRYRTGFWNGRPLKSRLVDLCRALGTLGVWIRLHYVYPYPQVDELLPLMAQGQILPYLDVPFQHASAPILKAMKRPGDMERMLQRVQEWRRVCPELTVRSTFIVGFPGETEDDFQILLDFLAAAELDRAGCFVYSPVAGAVANALPHPVPTAVGAERQARFMELQESISARRLRRHIGRTQPILLDTVLPDGSGVGRSSSDAPEIDGVVKVAPHASLRSGNLYQVRIQGTDAHDMWGKFAQN